MADAVWRARQEMPRPRHCRFPVLTSAHRPLRCRCWLRYTPFIDFGEQSGLMVQAAVRPAWPVVAGIRCAVGAPVAGVPGQAHCLVRDGAGQYAWRRAMSDARPPAGAHTAGEGTPVRVPGVAERA